jgi:hypothetical protein
MNPADGHLDQAGHGDGLADAQEAWQLPAPERPAVALRELGRIERTLFIWTGCKASKLRRRVHAGLNKGEARNALARPCSSTAWKSATAASSSSATGPAASTVTAAIVLWNTVYLERAANALRGHGQAVDEGLLQYLSPLGWEHINLTGDYLCSSAKIGAASSAATAAANGLACFI